MHDNAPEGLAMLIGILFIAGLVFLIALFIAPIKLYSIHREIKRTNDLLRWQADLLAKIEDRNRVEVGLLATVAHMSKEARERITS